jgi:hypothetical protein
MAYPDPGPLLDEQLDELELICAASERDGCFTEDEQKHLDIGDGFEVIDYVLGWHDRHDRKLLEAARWALANGWQRESGTRKSDAP